MRDPALYDAPSARRQAVAGADASRLMAMIARANRRLGKERLWPALSLLVEVERQHQALAEGGAKLLPIFGESQAFSADDRVSHRAAARRRNR